MKPSDGVSAEEKAAAAGGPRLEPPPEVSTPWKWVIGLVGLLPILLLLWLALRSHSPLMIRRGLDAVVEVGVGGVMLAGAYRLLLFFPYRLQDLLVMVVILAWAMKHTVEAARALAEAEVVGREWTVTLACCLAVGSVLLGSAALGLLYCQRLRIERPLQRAWVLGCGTLILPAASGSVVLILLWLGNLMVEGLAPDSPGAQRSDEGAWQLLWWLFSCLISGCNGIYIVRALALRANVEPKRTARQVTSDE